MDVEDETIWLDCTPGIQSIRRQKMKTYYQLVALAIFLSLGTITEQAEPERLCGRNLANALDLVCYDRGFHWEVSKRSDINHPAKRRNRRMIDVFIDKRNYHGRRGVVEECCYIGCTYETLESYCAEPGDEALVRPGNRFRLLMGRTTTRPTVPAATPRPPVVTTPGVHFPSAVFNSHPRPGSRKHRYFYVQLGTRPTRSPLI
ncbi:hypothetical protein LOTGIDRAFT_154465 [Lottia gigantea]|uniref:Insulin-like domain-containing protein n=1 Tax=Lottia gigantea TaxID=225164 RepID=V4A388_LOTGI|nr:hypothetical protein LOTGIDRAFT_154465 [Lottia gigantea]ESO89360.1 hypothetical protein LOTGIDRAFT_154465 [Lottia gigantea]